MGRMADPNVAIQEGVLTLLNNQAVATALNVPLAELPLRFWDAPPAQDAALPYILVTIPVTIDVGGVDHQVEVMVRAEVDVQVIGREEAYEPLQPIVAAIHQALQGATSVPLNGGGWLMSARRLRTIAYPEQTDAVEYRHLGGTYEVFAQ